MSTDPPATNDDQPLSVDAEVSQILAEPDDASSPDDSGVDAKPDSDDSASADGSSADPPADGGDSATADAPSDESKSGDDDSAAADSQTAAVPDDRLTELDRIGGSTYATGDAEEGWRQVQEDLRLARLVVPHLDKLQTLVAADRVQPDPEKKDTPPAGDAFEWNPAYEGLTQESDPKLLEAYQRDTKKLPGHLVAAIKRQAVADQRLADMEAKLAAFETQGNLATQRDQNTAAYQKYLAAHPQLSVDGDPSKGRSEFGQTFDEAARNPAFYDENGGLKVDASVIFDAAFGSALQKHPTALAPKPVADAPLEPHPSALHQAPVTKTPTKSSDDLFADALSELPENASTGAMSALLEKFSS